MSFIRKMFQSCVDYAKTAKILNTEAKIAPCGINTNTNLGQICGNACGCTCVKCLGCSASIVSCITRNKSCSNVSIRERLNARETGQCFGKNAVAASCGFCGGLAGCCCCPVETVAREACKTDVPICNPYTRAELDAKNLFWTKTCIDDLAKGPAPQTMGSATPAIR